MDTGRVIVVRTPANVAKAKILRCRGWTLHAIAKELGCGATSVERMLNPKMGEYDKRYYEENKPASREARAAYRREYRERCKDKDPMEHHLNYVLRGSRNRATRKGLDHDLDAEFIASLYPDTMECPILKIPIKPFADSKDNSPALDRVDNSKGYTRDNVQVISYRANSLKRDATLDELVALGNWAKKQQEQKL